MKLFKQVSSCLLKVIFVFGFHLSYGLSSSLLYPLPDDRADNHYFKRVVGQQRDKASEKSPIQELIQAIWKRDMKTADSLIEKGSLYNAKTFINVYKWIKKDLALFQEAVKVLGAGPSKENLKEKLNRIIRKNYEGPVPQEVSKLLIIEALQGKTVAEQYQSIRNSESFLDRLDRALKKNLPPAIGCQMAYSS